MFDGIKNYESTAFAKPPQAELNSLDLTGHSNDLNDCIPVFPNTKNTSLSTSPSYSGLPVITLDTVMVDTHAPFLLSMSHNPLDPSEGRPFRIDADRTQRPILASPSDDRLPAAQNHPHASVLSNRNLTIRSAQRPVPSAPPDDRLPAAQSGPQAPDRPPIANDRPQPQPSNPSEGRISAAENRPQAPSGP